MTSHTLELFILKISEPTHLCLTSYIFSWSLSLNINVCPYNYQLDKQSFKVVASLMVFEVFGGFHGKEIS